MAQCAALVAPYRKNILWNLKIPIDLFLACCIYSLVLSSEGALLEAILKWDRARADWCGATRTGRCGARGHASQAWTRGALGNRPCPMTGRCLQWLDGAGARGRKPSGSWRKPLLVPEERSQGRRSRRRWSAEKALPCALFPGDPGTRPRPVTVRLSALRFPSQRGGKPKAHLARRRENEDPWLFEM